MELEGQSPVRGVLLNRARDPLALGMPDFMNSKVGVLGDPLS